MVHSAAHAKSLYPTLGETKWVNSTILKHAISKDQAIQSLKSNKKEREKLKRHKQAT